MLIYANWKQYFRYGLDKQIGNAIEYANFVVFDKEVEMIQTPEWNSPLKTNLQEGVPKSLYMHG